MSRSIVLAVQTGAESSDLYRALTTSEGLRAFWTSDADAAAEVGSSLRLGFAEAPVDLTMRLTEAVPDELVAWGDVSPWPTWTGTEVTGSIQDAGESRTVVFAHGGFVDETSDVEVGMIATTWAKVLEALDAYATSGVAQPALG